MNYDIGIIGAGNVGATLGLKLVQKGHKVTFGVRTPEKYKQLLVKSQNITIEPAHEVVKNHKLLILAIPGREAGSILTNLDHLSGKYIIDATNMYGMQKLIAQFPSTHFVKAFNTIGYNIMENPEFGSDKVSLLYCGDNQELFTITKDLASDLGFEPVFIGDNSLAGDLVNFALLWIKMSRNIGRNFGFKLLHQYHN